MMTSRMLDLFHEFKQKLDEMPVIDVHTHINPEKPQADKPETVILYHYIVTELATAGISWDVLEKADMVKVLKGMRFIRNTSTYWCLLKILRDLYGLDEGSLKPRNWVETRRVMESASKDPRWVDRVLHEKVKARRIFITLNYASPIPSFNFRLFVGGLRIDPLISRPSKSSLDKLSEVTGVRSDTVRGLSEALAELFKLFSGHIKTVTVSLQPEDKFRPVDKAEAGEALKQLYEGEALEERYSRALSSYTIHEVLSLCRDYNFTFQIMLGVRRPIPGASPPDYAIVVFNPEALTNYCKTLFSRFRDVRFDLILANRVQSHETVVVAKNYPNVYLSGFWWYSFYPSIMRESLTERLQMLPRTKFSGFFSDAYTVEWVYGKVSLVKDQIAYTLAEMVEQGYYDKELALELAEDILYRNPESIYRL